MKTCFVIQPFDGDKYDKRYDSTYCPAIRDAGLEPYRVDRDPAANILIHDIEKGIQNSVICFAEITEDNPNVWFELGYAIGIQREVILVSSEDRKTKYPFDVQHRNIIGYKSTARQDFDELQHKITDKLKAALTKIKNIDHFANSQLIKDTQGLMPHEIVALAAIMQNGILSDGYTSGYTIKNDMNANGFTDAAVAIAIKMLLNKGLIAVQSEHDINGNQYSVYATTESGDQWIISNQDKLTLREEKNTKALVDDLPF